MRCVERVARWAVLAAVAVLAGCGGVLDPQGPVARSERTVLFDALAVMLVLIVPTLLGAAWVIWWFREGNRRATYRPTFAFSGRIEILVWSVPTLIIVFLGGVIWVGSHELDPYKPIASEAKTLPVQVVSLDWKWLFIYPEQGVASVNELVIPEKVPVRLEMTSASVMNTLWVPQLAGMIYTMNGMVTQLHLLADQTGSYTGRSGMYSGDDFSKMHFAVKSVAADAFAQWVAGAKGGGKPLDEAAYTALTRPSTLSAPVQYGSVEPGLFEAVATLKIAPAPGPANGPLPKTAEK